MKRGKCELWHALADLRDSHYLPKSRYKKMRASDLKNPNPACFGVARLNKLAAGPGLQVLRCRHEETRTPDLYRVNSEVSHT
jgi:hypothetical protein